MLSAVGTFKKYLTALPNNGSVKLTTVLSVILLGIAYEGLVVVPVAGVEVPVPVVVLDVPVEGAVALVAG